MDIKKIISDNRLPVLVAGVIIGMIVSLTIFSLSTMEEDENTKNEKLGIVSSNLNKTSSSNSHPLEDELQLAEQIVVANSFLRARKYDSAIEIYKTILAQEPVAIGAINNLAIAYFLKGEADNARQILESAVAVHSKTPFDNLVALYAYMAEISYRKVKTGIDLRNNGKKSEVSVPAPKINLILSDTWNSSPKEIRLAQVDYDSPAKKNKNFSTKQTTKKLIKNSLSQPKNINDNALESEPIFDNAIKNKEFAKAVKQSNFNKLKLTPQTLPQKLPQKVVSIETVKTKIKEVVIASEVVTPKKPEKKAIKKFSKAEVKALAEQERAKLAKIKKNDEQNKSARLEVFLTLSDWAGAWSDKDLKKYFSFYSNSFTPSNNLSIPQWKQKREERILPRDEIDIEISNVGIKLVDGSKDKARVGFKQKYQSGATRLTANKKVIMVREKGRWKILQENVK